MKRARAVHYLTFSVERLVELFAANGIEVGRVESHATEPYMRFVSDTTHPVMDKLWIEWSADGREWHIKKPEQKLQLEAPRATAETRPGQYL